MELVAYQGSPHRQPTRWVVDTLGWRIAYAPHKGPIGGHQGAVQVHTQYLVERAGEEAAVDWGAQRWRAAANELIVPQGVVRRW